MPKRQTKKQNRVLINFVIPRDGNICLLCLKTRFRYKERSLDHMDNDPKNNDPANIHVLCLKCNTGEENRHRVGKPRKLRADTVEQYRKRARERLNKAPGAILSHTHTHEAPGGIKMGVQKNHWQSFRRDDAPSPYQMESLFRYWLFRLVGGEGFVSREDAVNAGAEYLDQHLGGGSTVTVGRYFDKVISSTGWLIEDRDPLGRPIWKFRITIDLEELARRLEKRCGNLGFLNNEKENENGNDTK